MPARKFSAGKSVFSFLAFIVVVAIGGITAALLEEPRVGPTREDLDAAKVLARGTLCNVADADWKRVREQTERHIGYSARSERIAALRREAFETAFQMELGAIDSNALNCELIRSEFGRFARGY